MLPEPLPDQETERLMRDLRGLQLPPSALFVNRVLFAEDVGDCRRCRTAMKWQNATLSLLKRKYPKTRIYVVRNFAVEIAGKTALKKMTDELWELL